jgi:hypothetical protein
MRFEVDKAERDFLLDGLEVTLATTDEAVQRAYGREWDPYAETNPEGLKILVRARDDLAGDGPPWRLVAPRRDLELLFTRMRAGSSYALKVGGETVLDIPSLNLSRPDLTDEQLDTIALADRLVDRLLREGD